MQCVFIDKDGVVKKSNEGVKNCNTFLLVSAEDNLKMEELISTKVDLMVSSMLIIGCALMFAVGWLCHEGSGK